MVLATIFAVIAILAAVAAIIYYTKTSESLPGFLPGHRAHVTGHDTKRGLAAIIVAVVALLIAWASLAMSRPRRR
jgi:amino acid permease